MRVDMHLSEIERLPRAARPGARREIERRRIVDRRHGDGHVPVGALAAGFNTGCNRVNRVSEENTVLSEGLRVNFYFILLKVKAITHTRRDFSTLFLRCENE